MKKKSAKTNKTTTESERQAREARQQKGTRKSKAAREALDAAAALKRSAIAAEAAPTAEDTREAEVLKAKSLGIELADNEFLTKPTDVPEGAHVKKVVSRNGTKLGQPVYVVELPTDEPKKLSEVESRKGGGAKAARKESARVKNWAGKSTGGDRAKDLLDKLQRGTREKPVMAAKQLSDHERALARRLFAQGQIKRDKFEQGIGYFA